jgi:ribonuclease VapC
MSMVVDSSALVAIVLGEPDAERYIEALRRSAGAPSLSAASAVEATIVVEARQGREASRDLGLLIEAADIAIEPVTADQVPLAVDAWRRFGTGKHAAGLNLGDCFAYALARAQGTPLLFKGDDFIQTDIPAVL